MTPDPALPPPDPTVPHVLLFGHRGAGKSALIGALLQAGEVQGDVLHSEVVHSSVDLPRIRAAVYDGAKMEPHNTELVSYMIRLRPWRVDTKPVGEPLVVVLDDCDGRAAEVLLADPEPIMQRAPDSPVARAVVAADAIVLLVDAGATEELLQEAFQEFDQFLTVVGRAKTDARAVGGFPVFLVLTQCDRMVLPGDTLATWEARVKERVEEAWKKFETHLKHADPVDGTPSPYLPFGSIELNVFASAVRQPAVSGATAPRNHPYKVAELFRTCFAEARAHRARAQSSDKRLNWTVRAALAALVILIAGLTAVALFPPQPTGPELAEQVRDYLAHEPPAAVRLADGEIERNKAALARFTADSGYRDLDPELREFVESRVKEIDDYEEYRHKLASAPVPADARNVPELTHIRNVLRDDVPLPPQYAWGETAAAKLRDKWLADCNAIQTAEKVLVDKYLAYDTDGVALMRTQTFDAAWFKDVDALVARADQPQFPRNQVVEGAPPAIDQPRGEAVTYRVPEEYDEVEHARRYWEQTRDRLADLRDLADALGLTTAPPRPEPVLVLPEPGAAVDSAALAGARWPALLRAYPREAEGYPEWEVRNFPDPARTELAARLKKSFDVGVRHVHKLMKVEDTKDGWKALALTLSDPVYRDWGRLLHLLARLQDPAAPDPVAELSKFLADLDTKKFELDFRDGFDLSIPLNLAAGLDRVEAVGPLTITVAHGQEPAKAFKFLVNKGEIRGEATVYRLTPESPGKIGYSAGDDLRAELPVRAGGRALALRWETGGSNTFRFDRLTRAPRLTRSPDGTEPATGVKLTPLLPNAIPAFPALMPLGGK